MKARKSDSDRSSLSPIATNDKIYRLLVENVNDVLALLNAHGVIIYLSPSVNKVLGYNASERTGQSLFDHIHPEDIPHLKNIFNQLVKSPGSVINEIVRCQHKNGEWRWMEGAMKNLLSEPGVQAIVVNYRDVTERKHFESDLAKKSHLLGERIKELDCINQVFSIFEKSGSGVKDSLTKIVNIIPPAMQYPGDAEARIKVGKIEVKTADFRKTKIVLSQDIQIDGESVGILEVCYLKTEGKDSEKTFLKEEKSLISLVASKIGHYIDRKRVYEALHDNERKYRELVENANSIIMRWKSDGKIVFMNEFGLNFFGYTESELYGRHAIGTIVPEIESTGRDLRPLMKDIFNSTKVYENNINENMRRDGERVWIHWTNKIKLNKQGELIEILSIGTDITEYRKAVKALHESEERFKYVVKATSDAIWDWEVETDKLWCSDGIKRLFGFEPEELPSIARWMSCVHPDDFDRVESGFYEIINSNKESWDDEYRFVCKDGTHAYVEDRGFVIRDQQGKAIRMVGGITDITERIKARERILRLNRLYKMLSGINTLIVHVKDQHELFDGACKIAVETGGFLMAWIGILPAGEKYLMPMACMGCEENYLQHIRVSVDENDPDGSSASSHAFRTKEICVRRINSENINNVPWNDEALKRGYRAAACLPLVVQGESTGVMTIYASTIDAFDEDELKLLTEIAGDISYALKNIMQKEELEFLASYDPLTGLANETLFNEHLNSVLNSARKYSKKVALLVCDPKQFRNINNVYGREAGDLVLQETARRLRKLISDPANLGRITSNYFAMILHDVGDATGIAYMFEKSLFPSLSESVRFSEQEIQVNFCGGIAIFPHDGEDAETLYGNAEAAAKKAKNSGEQYLFYQTGMTERIAETLHFENRLRTALKQDEFVLHYQPKIDSNTRKIIGLEALIRWNDPETGLVPPGKFIPILEETGLILDVGQWALHQAAIDYLDLKKKFADTPRISVNVSALQLRQENFVDQVKTAISIGRELIPMDLEITESLIMTDIEQNISKLEAIRAAGLRIDIDDFGTGYSSLSYIAKLPADALKIDRSFIINMSTHPESMTIVATIISLGHSLKLKVIAEGVETEEQAKLLQLLKCDEMQGFLFSKPLPLKDILGLMAVQN